MASLRKVLLKCMRKQKIKDGIIAELDLLTTAIDIRATAIAKEVVKIEIIP
jgi:hypothetical protein